MSTVPVQYSINDVPLVKVSVVKDLGVLLDNKLSFSHHFESIIGRANRMLGFVKRSCRDFTNINVLKLLYVSFV